MEYIRKLLKQIGLQEQRIQMINLSSAMGGQFAFSAAQMTAEIKQLGPNPLRDSSTSSSRLVESGAGEPDAPGDLDALPKRRP